MILIFLCYGENYGDKDCYSDTPSHLSLLLMVQNEKVPCIEPTILWLKTQCFKNVK